MFTPIGSERWVESLVSVEFALAVLVFFQVLDGDVGGGLLLAEFHRRQDAADGIVTRLGLFSEVHGVAGFVEGDGRPGGKHLTEVVKAHACGGGGPSVELGNSLEGEEGEFEVSGSFGVQDADHDVHLDGLDGQQGGVGCDPLSGEELFERQEGGVSEVEGAGGELGETWYTSIQGDNMKKVSGRYVVDANGKKTEVLLPVEQFQELLEDLHDLAIVAERREEPTISQRELKRRLKADGLL